jgi:hypothetical protein
MGILVTLKYPTPLFAKLADHTYVECGTGARGWSCWGGKTGGTAFHSGNGSTRQANAIAEANERGGITCYLINGVCHQAANRILFPARILVTHARGYGVSEALFGPYGRPRGYMGLCRAPFDKHEAVSEDLPECVVAPSAAPGMGTPASPEETRYVDLTADIYAQQKDSTLMGAGPIDPKELLGEITEFQLKLFSLMMDYRLGPKMTAGNALTNMIAHRQRTEVNRFSIEEDFSAGTMKVREFTESMNNEFIDFQRNSADTLNEPEYQRLFGVSRDDEIWLGDPEIAQDTYSDFRESP